MEYASKGVAGAGLGLGIAGTALGLLGGANGVLGNVLGANACACHENMPVNRYELAQEQKIAELQSQVALRDANTFTDQKIAALNDRISDTLRKHEEKLCEQAVYNAANTAAVTCMNGQIAQLYSLTKLVVPNTSVCPGWGNVTITPATTTTG